MAACTAKLGYARLWRTQICGAHEYSMQQLRELLKHRHVAILGDSHGRHLFTWLVRMLDGAPGGGILLAAPALLAAAALLAAPRCWHALVLRLRCCTLHARMYQRAH